MWRKAVKMLVIDSISTLPGPAASPPVAMREGEKEAFTMKAASKISAYIEETIAGMPWFFRVPIISIATLTGLIGSLVTGKAIDRATAAGRRRVVRISRALPLYGNFSKLVRSLSFLAYFDIKGTTGKSRGGGPL